jgi:hypothetical protein
MLGSAVLKYWYQASGPSCDPVVDSSWGVRAVPGQMGCQLKWGVDTPQERDNSLQFLTSLLFGNTTEFDLLLDYDTWTRAKDNTEVALSDCVKVWLWISYFTRLQPNRYF